MNDQTSIPSDDKFPVKVSNFTRSLKVDDSQPQGEAPAVEPPKAKRGKGKRE